MENKIYAGNNKLNFKENYKPFDIILNLRLVPKII